MEKTSRLLHFRVKLGLSPVMSISLLSTKLHLPRSRANGVSRPRLVEKMLSGIQRSGCWILVSAPAGFGKTTLLSEFTGGIEHPVAWVSLDEADNDPMRFWRYVIAAFQSNRPEIGESALALLQTSQPVPDETTPTLLINDLSQLDRDLVLVLDDYHCIQNSSIHGALSFLLEHLPACVHPIIATRVDPPWPLARFRVRDQLVEIRASDLRFTIEETAAFLNDSVGLNLSAEDVAALEERTEGWIASLQLAALSMKGRADQVGFIKAFTGSHVYVAEYLLEEVLSRQSGEISSFLFRTCILERLQADLCNVVTNRQDSERLLKELFQSNLFLISLDDEGHWYRYHHLFSDLLRARLRQFVSEAEISALHRRAWAWFAENGFVIDAMNHALAGKDFESAIRLVQANAFSLMTRGELSTLLRWIEALPDSVIYLYPSVIVIKAWALTLAGAIHQVEPLLQEAEAHLDPNDDSPAAREVLGNAAAIRAFFAMMTGNYPRALELARHADTLLPESDVHISWLMPYTLGAALRAEGQYERAVEAFTRQAEMADRYHNLILWATGVTEVAIVRRLQGRLRDARETCLRALARIAERGEQQFGSLAKLEVPLIEVLREQNRLEEAHQRMTSVMARMQNWPMPTDKVFAYLAQIRLQEAKSDLAGAFETLHMAQEHKAKHPILMNLARAVDLSEVRLQLKSGNLDVAARQLDALQPGTSLIIASREQELLLLARLRLAQGRREEADQILAALAEDAEAGGRNAAWIEILALRAVVSKSNGEQGRALESLTKALTLGEPEGFVRIFVEEGEVMQELLAMVARRLTRHSEERSEPLRDYVTRILDAFPKHVPPHAMHTLAKDESGLIEPLTPREREVLQLIAAGDSNQTIAEKLVITLSAVKKHTRNIYGKLSVNSRTQAIAQARRLGLIPE